MLLSTLDATKAILRADPSLTAADRAKLLVVLRNHGKEEKGQPAPEPPRLLRRREVANRLGVSLRTVDNLSHRGTLTKVRFAGRRRASGFLEAAVSALILGRSEGEAVVQAKSDEGVAT